MIARLRSWWHRHHNPTCRDRGCIYPPIGSPHRRPGPPECVRCHRHARRR